MTPSLRMLSVAVGLVQSFLGGILTVLAYVVYSDKGLQQSIGVSSREAPLYMFVIMVIGLFLILSGLMLLSEENGRQEAAD